MMCVRKRQNVLLVSYLRRFVLLREEAGTGLLMLLIELVI
jgi:hypothetical protein